jgi:hypothetical protein
MHFLAGGDRDEEEKSCGVIRGCRDASTRPRPCKNKTFAKTPERKLSATVEISGDRHRNVLIHAVAQGRQHSVVRCVWSLLVRAASVIIGCSEARSTI